MFIAHRGLVNASTKENTIASFLGAINSPKYAGFELDIYTTKDGVFIINHNPLIAGKFIWNYTYKELKKKGYPKLEDILKLKTNKIILIEIKDINIDTQKLTKLLASKYKNICAVGDVDQAIYGFRGANYKNILNQHTTTLK